MRYIVNELSISINIDSNGIIGNNIRWQNKPLPYNFGVSKNNIWVNYKIDSLKIYSIEELTKIITDNIISSNVLLKED